jgi:pyrophosphatase PpaX
MKSYKYILLDWDGNLAKTLDIWLESLKTPLQRRGIHLADEEIGANFATFKERMEARGVEDIDAILYEADVIAAAKTPYVELYPDALTVLSDLKKASKRLVLVTTSEHSLIDPLLEKYQMRQLFDFVVCGDDSVNHKPDPEPLIKALVLLDAVADKEHVVMVGDSSADIEAADQAGVDSVLFYPPTHKNFYNLEELQEFKPTYTISDFHELLHIIKK